MFININYIDVLLISSFIFFLSGFIVSYQEKFKYIMLFTFFYQCGFYFLSIHHYIMTSNINLIEIIIPQSLFFYTSLFGFFYYIFKLKRSGHIIGIHMISDLAQFWYINKKVAFCLIVLILTIIGIIPLCSLLGHIVLFKELFYLHPILGIESFLSYFFLLFIYIKIIYYIILGRKKSKWFFDKLNKGKSFYYLIISTTYSIFFCFNSSFIWYFISILKFK